VAGTRFILSSANQCLAATLKNGTGGGAPAVSEATGYPMTNALQHDRYSFWQVASGSGTPFAFDVDLGEDNLITVAGLHGFRLLSGTMGTFVVYYASAAQGYNPAAWAGGTFGSVSGATLGTSGVTANRDIAIVAAVQTTRYLRYSFTHTTAVWSVGKLLASVAPTILAGADTIYGAGGVETDYRTQIVTAGASGHPVIEDLGDQGKAWQVTFPAVSTATKDLLRSLASSARPFSMLDDTDALYEVRIQSGAIQCSRPYGGNSALWDVTVELVRLG